MDKPRKLGIVLLIAGFVVSGIGTRVLLMKILFYRRKVLTRIL